MVSIRQLLFKFSLYLIPVLALILGASSAWSVERTARKHAEERATIVLDRFEASMEGAFQRAERLAGALKERWVNKRADLESPSTLQELLPFLDREGPVTSLMLYDVRQQILFLNLMDHGWVLESHRWADGGMASFAEVDGIYQQVPTGPHMRNYKVRERPWYQFVQSHPKPGWMPQAYRFPPGMVGITYLAPALDEAGTLQAIIGADVNLAYYAQAIWAQDPRLRAIEVRDGQGRLLVPAWTPTLERDRNAIIREQLSQPQKAVKALAERTLNRPGGFEITVRVLAQPGDLSWGCTGWGQVLLFPVLAVAFVLTFTHIVRGRLLGPLERMAAAQSGASSLEPSAPIHIRELCCLSEKLRRGGAAEIQLGELQRQIEHLQRSETLEAMAPGIVHDAKNQLAVAMGNLSLCAEVMEGHPQLGPYLERAKGATMRCDAVLKALLAYSRLEPGAIEQLDLNHCLLDAASLLSSALHRNISLHLELQESPCWILGERIKVQQVLLNLVINARDAMPEGGRIVIRTCRLDPEICLEVEDSGIGIPEAVRARIFEPFFTTKPSGKGTGLGLAMVASIVNGMGGRLEVHSQEGQGTCFRFHFPEVSRV